MLDVLQPKQSPSCLLKFHSIVSAECRILFCSCVWIAMWLWDSSYAPPWKWQHISSVWSRVCVILWIFPDKKLLYKYCIMFIVILDSGVKWSHLVKAGWSVYFHICLIEPLSMSDSNGFIWSMWFLWAVKIPIAFGLVLLPGKPGQFFRRIKKTSKNLKQTLF